MINSFFKALRPLRLALPLLLLNACATPTSPTETGRTAVPGFAVEEVDPTGAGDCFGAGFVSMRLRGATPEEALRVANACGALAVTKKGPMEGTATMAEVERFLAEQGA